MVGKDGLALVADGGGVVARADELAQTVGQQVAELGVRAMVNVVVAPQAQHPTFSVLTEVPFHDSILTEPVADLQLATKYKSQKIRNSDCAKCAITAEKRLIFIPVMQM